MRFLDLVSLIFVLTTCVRCVNDTTPKNEALESKSKEVIGTSKMDTVYSVLDNSEWFIGERLYPSTETSYEEMLKEVQQTGVVLALQNSSELLIVLKNSYLFSNYLDSITKELVNNTDYLISQGYKVKKTEEPFGGVLYAGACDSIILLEDERQWYLEFFITCNSDIVQTRILKMSGNLKSFLKLHNVEFLLNLENYHNVNLVNIQNLNGSWFGTAEEISMCLTPEDMYNTLYNYNIELNNGNIESVEVGVLGF